MNTIISQHRHEYERADRRAAPRIQVGIRCPNCYGPHVEQSTRVECGHVPYSWHGPEQSYVVYAYSCQTCGAEFVAGTTEHYLRRHYAH
jgi:hypothetical protein